MIEKVRPVSEMKTMEMSTQAEPSKEVSTTSSASKTFQITTSGPPTHEATTKYWETKTTIPRSGMIFKTKTTKTKSSKINKKGSIKSTSQSSRPKAKASLTKEKVASDNGLGNQISLSQGRQINVVVSAKEDTQRIIRMIRDQINHCIRREIRKEVERATVTFIHKRFPTAVTNGMGIFLKQNAVVRRIIHRMLHQYKAQVNIYARLLR